MKYNAKLVKLEYLQPCAEEFSFSPEGMVCDSPEDGESEGVGYEDWP